MAWGCVFALAQLACGHAARDAPHGAGGAAASSSSGGSGGGGALNSVLVSKLLRKRPIGPASAVAFAGEQLGIAVSYGDVWPGVALLLEVPDEYVRIDFPTSARVPDAALAGTADGFVLSYFDSGRIYVKWLSPTGQLRAETTTAVSGEGGRCDVASSAGATLVACGAAQWVSCRGTSCRALPVLAQCDGPAQPRVRWTGSQFAVARACGELRVSWLSADGDMSQADSAVAAASEPMAQLRPGMTVLGDAVRVSFAGELYEFAPTAQPLLLGRLPLPAGPNDAYWLEDDLLSLGQGVLGASRVASSTGQVAPGAQRLFIRGLVRGRRPTEHL
ncbi:MAG: hypothetical protein QM756_25470 [Polyangiaceae bacterium]